MKTKISVFWFRRDLRLDDNVGLSRALASGMAILPIFIFDPDILHRSEDPHDRRVDYIQQALTDINKKLRGYGASLKTFYARPEDVFNDLINTYELHTVYWNRDYEPSAKERDNSIKQLLGTHGILSRDFKDHVIFDRSDILKTDGTPYTVYTPYARRWKATLKAEHYRDYQSDIKYFHRSPIQHDTIHSLEQIGFKKTEITFLGAVFDSKIIRTYDRFRDYPALQQTSRLGIALRFGTVSIRRCVAFALEHNATWLSELIWRDFFMQILDFFPQVETQPFKSQYDAIEWLNDEDAFKRWCTGSTGFPIVDAGMRQLNLTGYMHNRARMISASFLCKHLLIDWRWGEAYFAQKLDDYDLSANNGNWQWAAGSGCDAAPYFRIFNPQLQTEKFDRDFAYIKQWVPEWSTAAYPSPIVDHIQARARVLQVYGRALKKQ